LAAVRACFPILEAITTKTTLYISVSQSISSSALYLLLGYQRVEK
jgi:hypothetical protein